MKAVVFGISLFASAAAVAGGFSVPGVPTKVDLVRGEGFMIVGEFGNPGGCTHGNYLFIKSTHPEYKMMYSLALTALVSKQKIYAYSHVCEPVMWYSASTITYNVITPSGSLAITN